MSGSSWGNPKTHQSTRCTPSCPSLGSRTGECSDVTEVGNWLGARNSSHACKKTSNTKWKALERTAPAKTAVPRDGTGHSLRLCAPCCLALALKQSIGLPLFSMRRTYTTDGSTVSLIERLTRVGMVANPICHTSNCLGHGYV